jgi:hypothetical protein
VTDAAPKAAATEPVRKVGRVWPVRRGGLHVDFSGRFEYWRGNHYIGWDPAPPLRFLTACVDGRGIGQSGDPERFDHIRVPEDFGALLPEGFEWAGCRNCALQPHQGCGGEGTDSATMTCRAWQPRGAA